MVIRDTPWPSGTPCWVDLGVEDIDKARAFYSTLLGWDVPPGMPEAGGYTMGMVKGKAVAGIGPKQNPGPPTWTTYIATEDVDKTAEQVKAAGGQVLVSPMDVMDVGRMAIAVDPGGAMFGIWQAHSHIGMGLANEPGAVTWNENMSRDFEGNKAFYHTVVGYEYEDMSSDEMKYAMLKVGGETVGGIGELGAGFPAEVAANWNTYFSVPDCDAAVAKITELGGTVKSPPMDFPYGRMATVTDDQGSMFSVISPPPGAANG